MAHESLRTLDAAVPARQTALLKARLAEVEVAPAEMREANRRLQDILRTARRKTFGQRSGKLSPDQFNLPLEDAALDAVRHRFRPVSLSSATTVAGLLPIIAERSPHVQTLVPLVVAAAFGLMASMVLLVRVFPAVLAICFDIFGPRGRMARFVYAAPAARSCAGPELTWIKSWRAAPQ